MTTDPAWRSARRRFMRLTRLTSVLAAAAVVAACSSDIAGVPFRDGDTPPAVAEGAQAESAGVGEVEPYVVKGTVTRSDGTPLSGVTVGADNMLAYDSNALGVTGPDGTYRIQLPEFDGLTWRMFVAIDVPFDGQNYRVELAVDRTPFGGEDGAIRDATWQLTGPHADFPDLVYGGELYLYEDFDRADLYDGFYRVSFTPEELIDGSTMEPFVIDTGVNESWINDIPIGRYQVEVGYVFDGDSEATPLEVQPRNADGYAPTATAGFRADTAQPLMELEVRLP